MERDASAAEEIRELLTELHGEVTTREKIPYYRTVRRASERTVAVLDWREHLTKEPGLLTQLGITSTRRSEAPVEIRRWMPTTPHPADATRCGRGCRGLCPHGHWITIRRETRPVPVVSAGAGVPGGSPGWDPDGALAPLVGSSPDPGEPVTEAWHAAAEIRASLRQLGEELHAEGWRRPATLVAIALEDQAAGDRILRRLRALLSHARIAADYDAPIVPLRDICCPECGGEMRVRADASSAVWCAGRWVVEGAAARGEVWPVVARCGAKWPQGSWVAILKEEADQEAS